MVALALAGTTTPTPWRRLRLPLLIGLALVLVPLLAGVLLGRAGVGTPQAEAVVQQDTGVLLAHNLTLAALSATGLLTFGLGTVVVALPSWFVVGTQVGAAWVWRGGEEIARGLLPHAPFELAGFACATALGVLPLAYLWPRVLHGTALPGRRTWAADVARLGIAAVVLLAAGALVETLVTPLALGRT